jgi:hypothetical protein
MPVASFAAEFRLPRVARLSQNGFTRYGAMEVFAMPRNLTGKQAKFAVSVAMGKSLADSYREAYEPSNPTAVSVYSNARRTRKHPLVARRIAELQVKLMPGPEDMRAAYQHALAVGLQLTVAAEDDRTRLRAAQWIAGEAEKSGKLEEEARKLRAEDVRKIEEILAAAQIAHETAAKEDAPPAKSAAEFLEEIRQAPTEAEVPKPPAPEVHYIEKLVSKPGHFPPQFERVAVRKPERSGA